MTAVLVQPGRIPREVPDWHDQGRCRDFPHLDFVDPGAVDAFDRPTAAKRRAAEYACRVVCSTCPLRLPCAVGALERAEKHGIWGGLDYQDRKRIAARYGYLPPGDPPPHGTNARRVKWGCDCPECKGAHALYEAMRREKKRAEGSAFVKRLGELREAHGWSYKELANRAGLTVDKAHSVAVSETAPDVDTVTALVRAFAEDPADRTRLAEELHQLAGTAVGVVEANGRRLLVMAGSRHDLEVQHLRALAGAPVPPRRLRVDRAAYRRRVRARVRRRRR
ncbi:WhiB family transcriptional regulator [Actinophytocola oryzae]|uniref:Helix-turn-helix protein n=1 Tax=Actinophytocola oryzae TaxID=502181 RepID=A0A4R7UUK2_9PSEU|nr:WhiB family transcriptional regulator [Actinophytocola oryzae]TDV40120.1 helix-turn-helix protein [Actinophytocola oryzae]